MRSFWIKLFAGYLLIIFTLSALIFLFTYRQIRSFNIESREIYLEDICLALKPSILPYINGEKEEALDAYVKELGKDLGIRLTIVDSDGFVLADSEKNPEEMENHLQRPEIRQAFSGITGKSRRYSRTVKNEMIYVGIPIFRDGEISHVIRASFYMKDISAFGSKLRNSFLEIVIIFSLLSLAGAYFLSRHFNRTVRLLKEASLKVSQGDFETRVNLSSGDEFQELGQSFNLMVGKINELFLKLSRQKEELQNILSSMGEGLCVIDRNGRIITANNSFSEIVRKENLEGKFYWEALRHPEFENFIRTIRKSKNSYTGEFNLNGKTFLLSGIFNHLRQEIIITFHDLTELKKLERIKKDFMVNVSHELRTPLTTIKGFVETLKDNIDDKPDYYLNIIKKHTDRLIKIVDDLLSLSELEEKGLSFESEKVDVCLLVKNVIKIFEKEIEKKNLEVEFKAEKEKIVVPGDYFRLEQMFINLIDNAIKYTEKGWISVNLRTVKDRLEIKISDSGPGIAREHLSRIFERFYVIDKSRSRKVGGTGLGLAIVKHIVLLHKGEIAVESEPGKGTSFIISLPL